MNERPYSRYTREKTWAALYSQHTHAGYALVPWSRTENSLVVISCKESFKEKQDLVSDTHKLSQALLIAEAEIAEFYRYRRLPDQAPEPLATALRTKRLRTAVVLAKSSDYYRYRIEDLPHITLVICGLHDSYIHLPVWETGSNKRYKTRETAISLTDPDFSRIRCTQFGHNILLAAYAKGQREAIALVEKLPERTQRRIRQEKEAFQQQSYRGRPLAFRDENERAEAAANISEGMRRYHARKNAK